MNSILITGGAGFIGTHTSLILLEHGYKIIIIDSFSNSSKKSIIRLSKIIKEKNLDASQLKFFEGDVRNVNFLRDVFQNAQSSGSPIDNVIHFAGLKSVKESILFPNLYWDVNVYGTIQLIKVMSEFKCTNFIFSSSATVYSPKEESPLYEDYPLNPIDPYGKTKLAVENLLRDFCNIQEDDWDVILLRYFNPIGAHPSGEIGECPLNIPNNLFPYICDVAISKREVLDIFGNDWPTKDGTCVRDFIHIMDLAEGHLAALNYLMHKDKNSSFSIFNLGTGKGNSVLELVKTFEKVNNISINYRFSERRLGDKAIMYSNCDLAKKNLNWEAKRNLSDMCKDGWNWIMKNPNGY